MPNGKVRKYVSRQHSPGVKDTKDKVSVIHAWDDTETHAVCPGNPVADLEATGCAV